MEENYLEVSREVLRTLTPRESRILKLREIDSGCTLELVGRNLGLTRQRIHQIETKIYRKLKHPSRTKYMKKALRLADKDIWKRLLKQQKLHNRNKNLIYSLDIRHLALGLSGEEDEKFSYLNLFIRILDGGLLSWLRSNSRRYKERHYTRGNLDEKKIEKIIDELERSAISSKRLYKIFKKTHLPKKMIIDMHRLIMNLWRDFTNEKIDRKFFVYSCKHLFAIDDPENWN
jgi:DNA-binding CsgD family transcriptional regulator|tara:strand:- start:21 stop:713 length:693 start_codon:yes stop_codon:yes gene_type:complete